MNTVYKKENKIVKAMRNIPVLYSIDWITFALHLPLKKEQEINWGRQHLSQWMQGVESNNYIINLHYKISISGSAMEKTIQKPLRSIINGAAYLMIKVHWT